MSMYLNNNDVVGDMQFELICLSPYLACLCIDNVFFYVHLGFCSG